MGQLPRTLTVRTVHIACSQPLGSGRIIRVASHPVHEAIVHSCATRATRHRQRRALDHPAVEHVEELYGTELDVEIVVAVLWVGRLCRVSGVG